MEIPCHGRAEPPIYPTNKSNQTQSNQTQQQVNLAFLAVQYAVLSLVLFISVMCGYAWLRRPRRGGPRVYLP